MRAWSSIVWRVGRLMAGSRSELHVPHAGHRAVQSVTVGTTRDWQTTHLRIDVAWATSGAVIGTDWARWPDESRRAVLAAAATMEGCMATGASAGM